MAIEAVIFDWGGTLTPWRTIDLRAEAAALAAAAVEDDPDRAERLLAAGDAVWQRSRDEQRSATLAEIFALAGLTLDEQRLRAYRDFWEPHTLTDPDVVPMFEALRAEGMRIGVLSNTIWPRQWHEGFFSRDGVAHLIDGAVYSSEIDWTKPHPQAFRAAALAAGVEDPARCVFVGDRLFDDIHGAQSAGMRAVHVPHSRIPPAQVGHVQGRPDAVIQRLSELPEVVARWR